MRKRYLSTQEWHERFVQQALWTTSIRNYLFNLCGFPTDSWILEVGCGTSAVLSRLPIHNPRLFGIDINKDFLVFGNKHHKYLQLTQGDGRFLPYPTNQFDLVYCHFLLLWVHNPISILQEFVRVGKKGSIIFILAEPDYGGRIDTPPALDALGSAQTSSLKLQGADPMMGRKVASLCKQAGISVIETGILGSKSSLDVDQRFIESEQDMLRYDLSGILPDKKLDELLLIDYQAWLDGSRVLYVPTFYLYGKIP